MMEIRISGDTSEIAEDINTFTEIITWACKKIKISPKSVDVILVDDPTLRELHKIYLNDDRNTDVMTFNLGDERGIEGEIYISFAQALEQSQKFEVSIREEITRLIIHACLHLAGFDDTNNDQRIAMKKKEDELVSQAKDAFLNSQLSD